MPRRTPDGTMSPILLKLLFAQLLLAKLLFAKLLFAKLLLAKLRSSNPMLDTLAKHDSITSERRNTAVVLLLVTVNYTGAGVQEIEIKKFAAHLKMFNIFLISLLPVHTL